jgi:hypothetical protein
MDITYFNTTLMEIRGGTNAIGGIGDAGLKVKNQAKPKQIYEKEEHRLALTP